MEVIESANVMISTCITSLFLIGLSGVLIDMHRRSWRATQQDGALAHGNVRFARSQYKRRMQASSIIGVLGAAIGIGPLVPREPLALTLYLAAISAACTAIMLLAGLDAWATRQNFHRMRSEQLADQVKLARELSRDDTAGRTILSVNQEGDGQDCPSYEKMTVDPFRLAIALMPVAAYVLLLGLLNLRRRPFLTSGGCDLAALGVALSGLMFIGPLELFRPEAATRSFGNYIWLFLVSFYWLWLVLLVLLSRPRLVIYNISAEELHPVLAETAGRLDATARWAGNNLSLPGLGVQLHLDSLDIMRNVSLVASGGQQNLDGWRRLARELRRSLTAVRVKTNPRAVGFLVVSLALVAICVTYLLIRPAELMQAMNEVFAY